MSSQSLKILIVSQYFYPESFRINDLVEDLVLRGHEVTVLTGLPNYPQGSLFRNYSLWKGPFKETYKGATVLRSRLIPRGKGTGVDLSLNYLSFAATASLKTLTSLDDSFDACFVFATSPITAAIPAVLHCKRKQIPLHIWVQDLWPESVEAVGMLKNPLAMKSIGQLVNWIYSNCDRIHIQSPAFKDSVVKWGGTTEKIRYLPNWADDPFAQSAQSSGSRQELQLPEGFLVLFAGNLGKAQSLGTILEAAEYCKEESDIQFIILGDGSEKQRFETLISEKNLTNIHCLGRKDPSEMPGYYLEAQALLVTLKDEPIFNLTIPSKVQTYLAAGRPILAAVNGEAQNLIKKSESGLCSAAEDGRDLAENIKKIHKMTEQDRVRLGENGRAFYLKHFQKDHVISQLLQELRSI